MNAFDLKGMREQWPNAKTSRIEPLAIRNGSSIPVNSFSGGPYEEIVAYSDNDKTITVLVVSAETASALSSSLPSFKQFVSSFQWLLPAHEGK